MVSFCSSHKSRTVVSQRSDLYRFLMHVPDMVRVRELGLEIVSLEETFSLTPNKSSMVGEKKYDGTRDPFKILL
jgi:hypothetical protein